MSSHGMQGDGLHIGAVAERRKAVNISALGSRDWKKGPIGSSTEEEEEEAKKAVSGETIKKKTIRR